MIKRVHSAEIKNASQEEEIGKVYHNEPKNNEKEVKKAKLFRELIETEKDKIKMVHKMSKMTELLVLATS